MPRFGSCRVLNVDEKINAALLLFHELDVCDKFDIFSDN
jgi:hypothetical protein